MESIAVTKADMTVARQELLSPFGLLTALFTEELARRSAQTIGSYRPMQLAYLEEDAAQQQGAPSEIHFDLDVNLLLDRLRKDAQETEKSEKKTQTPAERIVERVIEREKIIRTEVRDSRRVVIETGGQRASALLPVRRPAPAAAGAETTRTGERLTPAERSRQAGEGRSTPTTDLPRRSAALTQLTSLSTKNGAGPAPEPARIRTAERPLPLASQTMSVPAAGGWTPQQREA